MKRSKPFIVGFPSSVLDIEPSLREKTRKIGHIIRYLGIFRVDKALIYYDGTISSSRHKEYVKLFTKIHRYLITPPYLRKKLIPLDKELRYVGLIPPLRLKIFDVERTHPIAGEYRVGVVVKSSSNNLVYVDAGLVESIPTRCLGQCPKLGDIIVVKIVSLNPLRAIYSEKFIQTIYMGPILEEGVLTKTIHDYRGQGYLIIGTSRKGKIISMDLLNLIKDNLMRSHGLYLIFGGPYAGLYEIAELLNIDITSLTDLMVNTIPCQGTKTVRMEEALIATLSLLNMVFNR